MAAPFLGDRSIHCEATFSSKRQSAIDVLHQSTVNQIRDVSRVKPRY